MSDEREARQLRLERDLFVRLLRLGEEHELGAFLGGALGLAMEAAGAEQGYIELAGPRGRRKLWQARGLGDGQLAAVRHEIAARRALDEEQAAEAEPTRRRPPERKASLWVPIGGRAAAGAVYLRGRREPGPFSEEEQRGAELVARYLRPQAERLLDRLDEPAGGDPTAELRGRLAVGEIVGRSEALAEVFRRVAVAAPVLVPVLVLGESGTGKGALARAIHRSGPRASGPFVELNCASTPEAQAEGELFGAERGAQGSAARRAEGKIDAARGGTLFLDHIDELSLSLQGKLLMFLQSRKYYRIGAATPLAADVRVIAATDADLGEAVAQRRFREELHYRLSVLEIRLPPLRERPGDLGPIAEALAAALGKQHGGALPLSRGALVAIEEAEWPGNVRQLEGALQRAWALARGEQAAAIEARHLFPGRASAEADGVLTYQEATRRFQARFVREALEAHGWNVSETAHKIGLSRSHLNDLMRLHDLQRGPTSSRGS